MSEQYIKVKNRSDVVQRIFSPDGKRLELQPKAVEVLRAAVAKEFLAQCSKYVSIYEDTVVPERPGEETVWVANVTGSPSFSKSHEVERYDHNERRVKRVKVESFNKSPRVLEYRMLGAQVDSGDDRFNLPPVMVTLPPYERLPLPKSVAQYVINRDASQDPECVGAARRCRAPSNFEPNESWPLHEILFYASMVDDKVFSLEKSKFQSAYRGTIHPDEEFDVKKEVLRKLFFMLLDDRYNIPPRKAFESALERYLEAQKIKKARQVAAKPEQQANG